MHAEMITVRKHTAKLSLAEEMDRAMFRYQQGYRRLVDEIKIQTETKISRSAGRHYIYDIFQKKIVPLRLFHPVASDWENTMSDELHAWRLHNCLTAHIKTMPPAPAFRATARIGKFFASKF
jgi:hypothetical protein